MTMAIQPWPWVDFFVVQKDRRDKNDEERNLMRIKKASRPRKEVEEMNKEDLLKLRDKAGGMEEEARMLWSTLEAVHDAMRSEFTNPETYRDAIYGLSLQAYRLKEELQSLLDWLEQEGR